VKEVKSWTVHYLTASQLQEFYDYYQECPFQSFNTRELSFAKLPLNRYYMSDFTELAHRFGQIVNPAIHLQRSLQSQLPSSTALSKDGVNYVKDLRKVRQDGKTDKVITIDDNLEAYRVIPVMEDDSFKERYNFAKNTLLVPEFIGSSPEALHDTVLAKVSRVLQEILTKEDKCEALTDHYLTVDMMVRLVSADSTDSVMTHVVSNSSRRGETILKSIAV